MELKKLVEELNQSLYDTMCEGNWNDESFKFSLCTDDGEIEVELTGEWRVDVTIYHGNFDNEHELPNLTKFLEEKIGPDWEAVQDYWREREMDEWESHGFRDEADFWRWKEG